MESSDYSNPVDIYVESISEEIIIQDLADNPESHYVEASIMGLSPEREEEALLTLFFN